MGNIKPVKNAVGSIIPIIAMSHYPPGWGLFCSMEIDGWLLPASVACVHYELARWQRWLAGNRLDWRQVTVVHVREWLRAISVQAHSTVIKRA